MRKAFETSVVNCWQHNMVCTQDATKGTKWKTNCNVP